MRTSACFQKLLITFILLLGGSFLFAQVPENYCLKVKVRPTIDGAAVKGVTMKLYRGAFPELSIDTTKAKHEIFYLERGESYTIEVSAPGRLSRKVAIITRVPDDLPADLKYKCVMDVELPPELAIVNDYYLDFPVAIVQYDKEQFTFHHIEDYSSTVQWRLEEDEQ